MVLSVFDSRMASPAMVAVNISVVRAMIYFKYFNITVPYLNHVEDALSPPTVKYHLVLV